MLNNRSNPESGNIIFIILIAIVLIGALTAAIQQTSDGESANIDDESLAIKAAEVQRATAEIERGILYIAQNGISESDISFAHPESTSSALNEYGDITADSSPSDQVFHPNGGAANYPAIPSDIQSTSSIWEFYGGTHLPGVGSDKADLIAVLPNVTAQFCEKINKLNGQTDTQPDDDGTCLKLADTERFGNSGTFNDSSTNTVDDTTFTKTPALQACVTCGTAYHFYHVLLPR